MLKRIHPIAGFLAILTISTFWLATVISELFASEATVAAIKTAIPWGFLVLVPALVITASSGAFLSKNQKTGLVKTKLKRMPFIVVNGVLILIPSALFLAAKAQAGEYDLTFYSVQLIELTAGAVNIALLSLNIRDGFTLAKLKRHKII